MFNMDINAKLKMSATMIAVKVTSELYSNN